MANSTIHGNWADFDEEEEYEEIVEYEEVDDSGDSDEEETVTHHTSVPVPAPIVKAPPAAVTKAVSKPALLMRLPSGLSDIDDDEEEEEEEEEEVVKPTPKVAPKIVESLTPSPGIVKQNSGANRLSGGGSSLLAKLKASAAVEKEEEEEPKQQEIQQPKSTKALSKLALLKSAATASPTPTATTTDNTEKSKSKFALLKAAASNKVGPDNAATESNPFAPAPKNNLLSKLKAAAKTTIATNRLESNTMFATSVGEEEEMCDEAKDNAPFIPNMLSNAYINCISVVDGENPRLLLGCADSSIHVHQIYTGEALTPLEGHTDRVLCISIATLPSDFNRIGSKFQRMIISGCRDGFICIWDFKSLKRLHHIKAHKEAVHSCLVLCKSDGSCMAFTGSEDGSIRIFDGIKGIKLKSMKAHSGGVLTLCLCKEHGLRPLLISGGADALIKVWDVNSGNHVRMLEGHIDSVTSLVSGVFPTLKHLGAFTTAETLRLQTEKMNSKSSKNSKKKDKIKEKIKETKVAFTVLCSSGLDMIICVWDMNAGSMLYELSGHTKGVLMLTISMVLEDFHINPTTELKKGNPLLISSSEDKTIRIWNLENKKQLKVIKHHYGAVKGIATCKMKQNSGNRMLLASVGWDKTIKQLDLQVSLQTKDKNGCNCSIS